ncbi:MAG TPA: hypothetical protein VIA62_03870 [Thermoanaerobaculia bacterium]|jgi:hypothetical protein|nr:hypothetical protein [Thermoanaerobaculia bacterium]
METFDAKTIAELTCLPVRLVLDTGDSPRPAGVRRRDVTSRHLLYQAEELYLDLRLEPDPRAGRTALVGQLVDLRDPERPVSPVPVLLLSGDEVLTQTCTNGFGELQMDLAPHPSQSLRLCLALDGERRIEVPIDRSLVVARPDGEETA